MTVTSLSTVRSQADTPVSKSNSIMGKDDFLTLLVAQLRHQDPLNPSESTEFTAQLAQFSSLEQLQNIHATVSGYEVYQSTLNNIQSSGFIGKTVTASGSHFAIAGGVVDPIRFDLNGEADSVYVQIYDRDGTFVNDLQVGSRPAGEQQVAWNGRNANGTAVADGTYQFTVMAMKADGSVVGSTSYTTGVVTGVDYKSGDATLLIGSRAVPISAVIRIEERPVENSK